MNYKTRLTLLFVGLFFVVLTAILSFVYISYSEFRRDEFFERLRQKSFSTARLLVEVKGIDADLLKVIDQNSINKMYDEKILIFDENNKLIYSSLDDEKIPYSANLIQQIRTSNDKYYVDEDGDEVVGIHYTGQGHDYVVLASAYDMYGISKLRNLKDLIVLALLLGTVLISAASYFYIRQVFRPIDDLNKSIQNITANNLKGYIAVTRNKDELDTLATNYNNMLERLAQSFESQRAFVRNAAHELKTPLALIHGKLERLEDLTPASNAEAEQLLKSLVLDVNSQATLIESLLLIQRLQSQLPINTARVRVDELLYESVKELSAAYPEQRVKIDIEATIENEDQLIVNGNELLLKICFRNLIENAALYATDNDLDISIHYRAGLIEIVFSNAGHPPSTTALFFEPFFRETTQSEKPGHGLGLSIVKQISEIMKGETTYTYISSKHIFTLKLPGVLSPE